MSLSIALPTPAEDLKYASESLSDLLTSGLNAAGSFTGRLMNVFPALQRGFAPVPQSLAGNNDTVSQLREMKLSREQNKFMRITKDVPYAAMREMKAHVPAGLKVTYLELLAVLLPATERAMEVRGRVIEPYQMLLAKLVSDKNGHIATVSQMGMYRKLEGERDSMADDLGQCFRPQHEDTETTIKKVVERNADWADILVRLNTCGVNLEAIDLKGIQKQLADCSNYLDLLFQRLKAGGMDNTTREAAQGLAAGAYSVAQEMELVTATFYRVLQLTTAVDDTIKSTIKSLG